MKKIIVKIEIKHIDQWHINWADPSAKKDALIELNNDIRRGVAQFAGVYAHNMEITSIIEE